MQLGRHKQYIVEWGSVSNDVIRASKQIARIIWNDSSEERQMFLSEKFRVPYIEGDFDFNFGDFGFNINSLVKITYTMYFTRTIDEYNHLFYNNGGDESSNSFCDFENSRINIVTGIIDGYVSQEFFSNVMHEVEHYFEYSMGMKKNENFYQNMRSGLKSSNEVTMWCSRLMYFCFKHEIDAFVHEFYGKLVQTNFNGSFEEALNTFDEYLNAVRCRDMVIRVLTKQDVKNACKELNISFEHLKKYSNFAINKLKRKMFNAYVKYTLTRNGDSILRFESENRIKSLMLTEYRKLYSSIKLKEEKYIA